MIGAGVFVFPGLAAREAGSGACMAFLLAGFAALLVALCTAELATAMPKSGGAYCFVSQAYSKRVGFVVGIAQWFGLLFAASFYLSGFTEYLERILGEVGSSLTVSEPLVMLILGMSLLVLNIVGAKSFSRVQNIIVLGLVASIILFIFAGLQSLLPSWNQRDSFPPLLSYDSSRVFSTAALVFTAFLGFLQIATIGGEVKNPNKSIPQALIGSVLTVTILYVSIQYLAIALLGLETLAELSETATVQVAEKVLGLFGACMMLISGLLAMVSSANASILSASRTIYALAEDGYASHYLREVSERFETPHFALGITVFIIMNLSLWGKIEILAEIASCLHLIIYALVCLSVLVMRKKGLPVYNPSFNVPLSPLTPVVSSIVCFSLVIYMDVFSILLATSILILSIIYFTLLHENWIKS